ncbi:hypothetical protein [Rhodococcus erythropolis]
MPRKRREPNAEAIFKAFDAKARRFESIATSTSKPALRKTINLQTRDALFTSSFLSVHTAFESFLEDLFYSAVLGDSGITDCVPFTKFESRENAERVFMGGKAYLDWLPYDRHSQKISKLAFADGIPFSRLDRQPVEKKLLDDMSVLRNAIAHQSTQALTRASGLTSNMRPRRRHVAGYLQDKVQGDTRYSLLTTSMRSIALALSAHDTYTARRYLNPERAWAINSSPGIGKYECTICRKTNRLRSKKAELPRCSDCRTAGRSQKEWRKIYEPAM